MTEFDKDELLKPITSVTITPLAHALLANFQTGQLVGSSTKTTLHITNTLQSPNHMKSHRAVNLDTNIAGWFLNITGNHHEFGALSYDEVFEIQEKCQSTIPHSALLTFNGGQIKAYTIVSGHLKSVPVSIERDALSQAFELVNNAPKTNLDLTGCEREIERLHSTLDSYLAETKARSGKKVDLAGECLKVEQRAQEELVKVLAMQ